MKQFAALLFVVFVLFSCGEKEKNNTESKKQHERVNKRYFFEDLPNELKYDVKVIEAKQVSKTIQGKNGLIFNGAAEGSFCLKGSTCLPCFQKR